MDIQAVETGHVVLINYQPSGAGIDIVENSDQDTNRQWVYMHMFKTASTQTKADDGTGRFKLFKIKTSYVIVKFADSSFTTPLVGYTADLNLDQKTISFSGPGNVPLSVKLVRTSASGDAIGPVGLTGHHTGAHIHLGSRYAGRQVNPLLWVNHDFVQPEYLAVQAANVNAYSVKVLSPMPNAILGPGDVSSSVTDGSTTTVLSFPISALVNSRAGLDLNRVVFSLVTPQGSSVFLGGYDYGGALSKQAYSPILTVAPQSTHPGLNKFYLPSATLQGINLPSGDYHISIEVCNVGGQCQTALSPIHIDRDRMALAISPSSSTVTFGSDGKFSAAVAYSVDSDLPLSQVEVFDAASDTGPFTLRSGGPTGLGDGKYLLLARNSIGGFVGQMFTLATTTGVSVSGFISAVTTQTVVSTSSVVLGPNVTSGNYSVDLPAPQAEVTASFNDFGNSGILGAELLSVTSATAFSYQRYLTPQAIQDLTTGGGTVNSFNPAALSGETIQFAVNGKELARFSNGSYCYVSPAPGADPWCYSNVYSSSTRFPVYNSQFIAPISLAPPVTFQMLVHANTNSICAGTDQNGGGVHCTSPGQVAPIFHIAPDDGFATSISYQRLMLGPTLNQGLAAGTYNIAPGDRVIPLAGGVVTLDVASPGFAKIKLWARDSGVGVPLLVPNFGLGGTSSVQWDVLTGTSSTSGFSISWPSDETDLTASQVSGIRLAFLDAAGAYQTIAPSVTSDAITLHINSGDVPHAFIPVVFDQIAPATVIPNSAAVGADYAVFTWTAPGDDGTVGQAASYVILAGACPDGVFDPNTVVPAFTPGGIDGEDLEPSPAGKTDGVVLDDLIPNTTYCLSVSAVDRAGNKSPAGMVTAVTAPVPEGSVSLVSSATTQGSPDLTLTADNSPPLTMLPLDPTDPDVQQYYQTMSQKYGRQPVSPLYELGPSGVNFATPAQVTMAFDPAVLQSRGIPVSSLQIYESNPNSVVTVLPNQTIDATNHLVHADVTSFTSKFAIFGSTLPPLSADVTPPETVLAISSPSVTVASNLIYATTTSIVSLVAHDPAGPPNSVIAGLATTYFLVDAPFISFSSTPPLAYSAGFSLPLGTHTISYFSQDLVGNMEAVHLSTVIVVSDLNAIQPPPPPPLISGPELGLAIASDAAGRLWEVGNNSGRTVIGRYETNGSERDRDLGNFPQNGGSWGIHFDSSGNVYVVGSSLASPSGLIDLVVYKVSPDLTQVSSTTFHDISGDNALTWDSEGSLWITGYLQHTNQSGGDTLTLGLWHYDFTSGLVELTTTYSSAGIADGGLGIRALNGNLYVAGYTSTTTLQTPSLGFALWEFDGAGHGPIGGPWIRPNYLTNVSGLIGAKVETAGGKLFVAAQRTGVGGENDLGFLIYAPSGALELERYETFGSSINLVPQGAVVDPSGNIAYAVQAAVVQNNSSSTAAGIFRFSQAGDFIDARADSTLYGGVQGIAVLGADIWLAVDGSTSPHRFNGDSVLPVSDVFLSSSPSHFSYSMIPSTGAVGIPFALAGPNFGAYAGTNTRVLVGGATAPISAWNDTAINGTIPGLSTGTYTVAVARMGTSSDTLLTVGAFQVLLPSATAISVSSAPIGAPFILTGTAFGPYAGANTSVLIGGTTAPISVWNDSDIEGTVPGLSTGTYPIVIRRQAADGFTASASPFELMVVAPSPQDISPSSAPIGAPFVVTGNGFGPYAGANTRILFDGKVAPVSVWNDTTIQGTVPGLPPGPHPIWIERASSDGGLTSSATAFFTVLVPTITTVSPAAMAAGGTMTVTGSAFGVFSAARSQLLVGGSTAAVTDWSDSRIVATVPGGLAGGIEPVQVRLESKDGFASLSNAVGVDVVTPVAAVGDLGFVSVAESSATLRWTAPTASAGLAAYDLRVASVPIDGASFLSATPAPAPLPAASGTIQTLTVPAAGPTFYVALKSSDATGNVSALSNVASLLRSAAVVAGSPESIFFAEAPVTPTLVSMSAAGVALASAAAQDLTSVSGLYSFGSAVALSSSATLTIRYSTQTIAALGLLPSDLKIYEYAGASGWVALSMQSIDPTAQTVTAQVPSLSSIFALLGIVRDRAAPVTALSVAASGRYDGADGRLYASSDAAFGFAAFDPVVFGTATGVAYTEYRVDASSSDPFVRYSAPFALAEGSHTIVFRSADAAGNLETAVSSAVFVDASAPALALSPADGSTTTAVLPLLAAAYSDAGAGTDAASARVLLDGVDETTAAVVTASSATLVPSAALAQGRHALEVRVADRVGNRAVAVSSFLVDSVPPVTRLLVDGLPAGATSLVVISTDSLGFSAADAGAGVARTLYALDGTTTPAVYSSTFSLAVGTHALDFWSTDLAGNAEASRSVVLAVRPPDSEPPRTSLAIGAPRFGAAPVFVTPGTPLSLSAVDDRSVVGDGIGLGVAETRYSVDGGSYAVYAASFTLAAEGTRVLRYYSVDVVGNVEAVQVSTLAVDAAPPVTTLTVSTPAAGGFVSAATVFALSAQDPVSNGVASGVAFTRYAVNGSSFAAAPSSFTLTGPDGVYALDYRSQDEVGNLEVVRSTTVYLDRTPPVATASVGAPSYAAADGTLFVTPATPVVLSAVDPSSGAVASGVERIEVSVDGGAYAVYAATLTFAEGSHSIAYRAIDRVGNASTPRTLSLRSDATPPLTAFAPSGSVYSSNGRDYAPAGFAYALVSTDPVVNGVASGVAATRYALDGGAFQVYASTFGLGEGVRTVAFLSEDRVGNVELTKSATVYVDATPPLTALTVGAPQSATGETLFVSTVTPFALSARDPVVNGVASGVRSLLYGLDAGPLAPYVSSFTLTAPEGARTLSWRADDNVGNQEVLKSSAVFLDEAPPVTSLAVLGGRQAPGPDAASFYASSDTRFALVSTDAASGLAFTRWQDDGGAFQLYLTTFTLAEGAHALAYQSQDRVLNLEVLRSTTVLVDATAPISTATVGAPLYAAADGTLFVSTATPVTLSAADRALPGGRPGSGAGTPGSGVALLEASLDGGPFVPYSAPLTFAEGRHTLLYKAVDAVGNAEAAHALALSVDATPPVSSLVVGQPQFALSSATVLVSAVTPLAISAQDPVAGGVASGVQASYYRVFDAAPSTAAFSVFAASFTLSPADGPKTVEFYSRDQVFNMEAVKSRTLLLDSTPPAVSLTSPHAGTGICAVVKGKVPVLGSVSDGHLASFELDAAPGQDATTGYALVSSGTADASGTLGVWDASRLAGWQTLRLTAADAVQNVAVTTVTVFVGDPATLMVLGNDALFNMPQGVAADAAGNVFVADTNDDEIQIFTALGSSIAVLGRTSGRDDHDDKVSSTTLVLNKPQGVAPAADGSLWIADTENDRVLKVSSAGQVLLSLGRLAGKKGEHDKNDQDDPANTVPGSGPGEFDHPSAVAVDAAGNVFVADTENHRVQKLAPDGTPLLAFTLPPLSGRGDDHDGRGDKDDAKSGPLGRPAAVALDAAGRIYAADPDGGRALEFGATGQLLLTIPIPGGTDDRHPVQGQPDGIAVSPDGSCILVADALSDRVFKFDALGNLTLVFGVHGRHDERKDGIRLNKPAGLAFAPDGTLLVADRNNDRVERYGAPNGRPTLVTPPDPDDPEFTVREVVAKDEGGTVERDDKAAVSIPAGALPDDLKISVSTMSPSSLADADRMQKVAAGEGMKPGYAAVEYGPEGTKFAVPVTLTIPYDPGLVAAEGMSEDSLAVRYWDPAKGDWQTMPSTVDKSNHTVTAKTPHFSLYQVLGSTGTAPVRPLATADPAFTFHDAYAFPNPVRGARAVTLRVQPGLADSVSVRVYDLTGRKVHDSSDFRQDILDDGNGKGFQYTYDHVWDVSGVGSGVYYYVITAVKSGKPDIHKSGRVGVIK